MPVTGTRIGVYEVIGTLGVGGMDEVYRARDTRLKREGALKLLPESLAADPDRLARFQREAEVPVSLNHPNIAAIHGLEDSPSARGPFFRPAEPVFGVNDPVCRSCRTFDRHQAEAGHYVHR